jgi:hypothetical protein
MDCGFVTIDCDTIIDSPILSVEMTGQDFSATCAAEVSLEIKEFSIM